jgi:integrase
VSVYKPKNSSIYQYDFVRNGRRFHGSTGVKSKRAAEQVEEQKRIAVALDTGQSKRPAITLDDAAGIYEARLRANGKWSHDYVLVNLIMAIGASLHLSEITQTQLSDHFAARAAKVSASSVNREIEMTRALWRNAMRAKYDIGDMPDWGALMYAVAERDPRELRYDEEDALFEQLRKDVAEVTRFALLSGWRKAEVIGLRWADLNLPARTATTRIKGGDTVKRALTNDMVLLVANQPKVGPFVFTYVCQKNKSAYVDKRGRKQPARKKGERYPMTATVLRKPFAEAKEAAGIEGFRFHDLRHTRGTRILRATGNIQAAKEALKHRSIKTTLRYAHAADEDVRNALDASESRIIPEVPGERRQKS